MQQDKVVGMIAVDQEPEETIMVVSEQGYGKRSEIEDYRITNRGGKGVKTLNITDKTGKLVSIQAVTDDNDLVIINKSGITLRVSVADFRVMGRATQGVKLISLREGDSIAAVCAVSKSEDPDNGTIVDVPAAEGSDAPATEESIAPSTENNNL